MSRSVCGEVGVQSSSLVCLRNGNDVRKDRVKARPLRGTTSYLGRETCPKLGFATPTIINHLKLGCIFNLLFGNHATGDISDFITQHPDAGYEDPHPFPSDYNRCFSCLAFNPASLVGKNEISLSKQIARNLPINWCHYH